jgi:hypothetical protein
VKLIATWPVAVSEAVARLWLLPLFGHSIAAPPEAAASLTTANGENVLWPDRLSSSTTRLALDIPLLELDEDELLEELELEELLDEELEELLLEEDELELEELLLDEEELLEDELEELLLDEEEEELLEEVPPVGSLPHTRVLPSYKAIRGACTWVAP